MAQKRNRFEEGVVKLIPIPVTSGRDVIVAPERNVASKEKPYEWDQSSVEAETSTEGWQHVFEKQSNKIGKSLSSLSGYSLIFEHGPAIISGIIIGLMLVHWIGGLNEGAQFIVIGLSILASEIIFQLLKKPHILVGVALSIGAMSWIDGLNLGAKLIVLFAAVCLSDAVYQLAKKIWKPKVLRAYEHRH